jgi:uncharacterized membrane protein
MPLFAANSIGDFIDQSLWAGIGLVVALLVLAWLVYRLRAWYGDDADSTDGNHELLTHLRDLRREGEVSEEEFRSIKGRLTERMDP